MVDVHISIKKYVLCYYIYFVVDVHTSIMKYVLCYYIYFVVDVHISIMKYVLCYYIYFVVDVHISIMKYVLCYYIYPYLTIYVLKLNLKTKTNIIVCTKPLKVNVTVYGWDVGILHVCFQNLFAHRVACVM